VIPEESNFSDENMLKSNENLYGQKQKEEKKQ
jgi:hypothetical protein